MFGFFRLLLVVFVVIPLIRSVVQTVVRAFRGTVLPQAPKPEQPAAGASAATLLHQDPVCGTYVPAGSSLRKICNGKVFHFCSDQCRDRFNG